MHLKTRLLSLAVGLIAAAASAQTPAAPVPDVGDEWQMTTTYLRKRLSTSA